ncbi:MAG: DUF4440 domain-containing protein [Sphingobacteriales bacterium]|nr:MAG: DUF4440 domain-containing protein [Sphingobacteriales bacterium]
MKHFIFILLTGNLLLIYACNQPPPYQQQEIIAAMQKYDDQLMKMNTDSIAFMYSPDGELGEVAKGRDSISRFLKKFAEFRVLSNHSQTTQIVITGDSAIQKGNYKQVTILPSKDTVKLSGQFTANWIRLSPGGWRIKKMVTIPDK